ncbi:MAG TPA: hypothetical protein QGH10_19075 [Armatimonadota bacterium]|nr:hypothetical protein [Armatimonadota bacterium]
MLYGLDDPNFRKELEEVEARITQRMDAGFVATHDDITAHDSRVASSVAQLLRAMAGEAKEGPRFFTVQLVGRKWYQFTTHQYRVQVWCEAEGCQHLVFEPDMGQYDFEVTKEWVRRVAPYANFAATTLRAVVPMVIPAVDTIFGADTMKNLKIGPQLKLMKEATSQVLKDDDLEILDAHGVRDRDDPFTQAERSGIRALHALIKEKDPTHAKLGLRPAVTPAHDIVWLCDTHYKMQESKIPDVIE